VDGRWDGIRLLVYAVQVDNKLNEKDIIDRLGSNSMPISRTYVMNVALINRTTLENPGEFLPKISDWPLIIQCLGGDRHLRIYALHERYGRHDLFVSYNFYRYVPTDTAWIGSIVRIGYLRQEFPWIFREWMEGETVYDYQCMLYKLIISSKKRIPLTDQGSNSMLISRTYVMNVALINKTTLENLGYSGSKKIPCQSFEPIGGYFHGGVRRIDWMFISSRVEAHKAGCTPFFVNQVGGMRRTW